MDSTSLDVHTGLCLSQDTSKRTRKEVPMTTKQIQALVIDSTFIHSGRISHLGSDQLMWLHDFEATGRDTVFFTDDMMDISYKVTCKRKIAMLIEPPEISPHTYEYIKENAGVFDYILTYSRDLHTLFPNKCLWYPPSTIWTNRYEFSPKNKSLFVSLIASNKKETSGQKLRQKIAEAVKEMTDIHVFGKGRDQELKNKEDGLIPYQFSIAIENSVYDDYFTEKILDCFATGTIPIYYGTKYIDHYFDSYGIIQFNNLEQLLSILEEIRSLPKTSIQEKYMRAAMRNFQMTILNYKSTEDFLIKHYPFLFQNG